MLSQWFRISFTDDVQAIDFEPCFFLGHSSHIIPELLNTATCSTGASVLDRITKESA